MAVYFSKKRGAWFIRQCYRGKAYYCYRSPDGPFVTKGAALAYGPVFSSGLVASPSSSSPVLCSSYDEAFLSVLESRMKPSGVYTRRGLFRLYIAPVFGSVCLSDVDGPFVERFNRRINKGVPTGSLKPVVSLSRVYLRFLRRYCPAADASLVYAFADSRVRDREYRVWDLAQERAFLSAIDDPRDRLLFSLLVYYGFRIGELLALKGSDFSGGFVSVRRALCEKSLVGHQLFITPKTKNSVRTLPVVKQVAPLVASLPRGWVFPSIYKGVSVLSENSVHRLNAFYCAKAGLGHPLKIHEFRHSCASNLLKAGIPVRIVARWLGDTEATVMNVYSHLFPAEKQAIKDFYDGLPE